MAPEHYYGDIVRRLFLVGAAIMLISYPFFSPLIPQQPVFTVVAIALLSVMAGLTNPRQRWTAAADIMISLTAVGVFEYYAIMFSTSATGGLFLANQLLALIFLVSSYFSVKTFRGMSLRDPREDI